jgi:endonuclease YncB( thermonuclease family)
MAHRVRRALGVGRGLEDIRHKRCWLYGFLAILAGPLLAAELTGKVVGISDGDTLTLLVPEGASFKQVRIRLAEIDAPESGQPYGRRSKQVLSDMVFKREVRIPRHTWILEAIVEKLDRESN